MSLSRRDLLQIAGIMAGTSLLPKNFLFAEEQPAPAGDGKRLRVAAIGVGSKGRGDLASVAKHKSVDVVAVCDPDKSYCDKMVEKYNCKSYADYRELFKEMADQIDGVIVATTDHMHAPIALLAMALGKHVYCQKPLARTIGECRAMANMAEKMKVITQMGIQIHSTKQYQTTKKWVQEGVIGKVHTIHSGIGNKPWGGVVNAKPVSEPPATMSWNNYVGVAPDMPWRDGAYHPGNWRKWVAFGTGIQGDMGCHVFDPVYMAVGLTTPTEVVSLGPPPPSPEFFAFDCHVKYIFPRTSSSNGNIEVHWRNGNLSAPAGIHPGIEAPKSGALIIGDKGALAIQHFGPMPTVVDSAGNKLTAEQLPPEAEGSDHYLDWVDAAIAKDQSKASAPFAYGGRLTEAVLMGVVINNWPEKAFTWDGESCKFTGGDPEVADANALIWPRYREVWSAPGITA